MKKEMKKRLIQGIAAVLLLCCVGVSSGYAASGAALTEDFTSYSPQNAPYVSGDAMAYHDAKNEHWLGTTPFGAVWKTSCVHIGQSNLGCAYLDTGRDWLAIRGRNVYMSSVNLDMAGAELSTISRIRFKVKEGTRAQGLMLCVSQDEKTYLMFGSRNGEVLSGQAADSSHPAFVSKVVNGAQEVLATTAEMTNWPAIRGAETEWTITLEDSAVSWSAVKQGVTWSGSYTDTDGILQGKYRYPLAAFAIGDAFGYLCDLEIAGQYAMPGGYQLITANDTCRLLVRPAELSMTTSTLTLLVTAYAVDGSLYSAQLQNAQVAAGAEEDVVFSWTADHTAGLHWRAVLLDGNAMALRTLVPVIEW